MKTSTALTFATLFQLAGCADEAPHGREGASGGDDWMNEEGSSEEGSSASAEEAGSAGDSAGDTGDTDGESFPELDPEAELQCEIEYLAVEAEPGNVMLVLDKSGSMSKYRWDDDDDDTTPEVTRWNSLHRVVNNILGRNADRTNYGLALFPAGNATGRGSAACSMADAVEVEVASSNASAILAAIPDETATVAGGTPATRGIENAVAHLQSLDPEIPREIILITDGAANCKDGERDIGGVYDIELETTVANAFDDHGIRTHVIGIDIEDELQKNPYVNPFESLNEVARAGGASRDGDEAFYNTLNEDELAAAVGRVTAGLGCTFELEHSVSPHYVNVEVGGESFTRIDDCETQDGWSFVGDGAPYDKIQLCGQACQDLQATGELEVEVGCPPVP